MRAAQGKRGLVAALCALGAFLAAMVYFFAGGARTISTIGLLYAASMIFAIASALRRRAYGGIWAALGALAGSGALLALSTLIAARTFAWYILLFLAGSLGGVLAKNSAADRDRNSPLWFLLGFVCPPAAFAATLLVGRRPETGTTTPGRIPRLSGNRAFSRVEPWLYLAPFLAGLAVFTLYPVVNVVFLSFKQDYSYLTRDFAGWSLGNYQTVLGDKYFAQAIRNTLVYALCVVPVSTCIAVVVAYLLSQKLRGSGIFQTAFFLPMVTSITAVGLAWKLMFNTNFGIINYALSWFGISPVAWLDSPDWRVGLSALVIFGIWNILPFTIILLLSGLQNIDPQYYTAARIDGAKGPRIFFRITVPLLAPTIFLVCIINTISSFKVFSELYPLFKGEPGPYNNLYTVVYYIRTAMLKNRDYGVAAAAAIILFGFIFVFTMIQLVAQKRLGRRTGR